jgi:phenylpyruvate tautomerase PptA (4-oxalocrotonate tautomerase family)
LKEGGVVPLVRIDLVEGREPAAVRKLADVVQEVLEEVFAAPPRDRYQVIDEHPSRNVILQDTGLGFERTDDRVLVQVFQQGRSEDQKKALYARLAERLESDCGVAPTDLMVSVAANSREDWSFGLGRAQFLEGDL